MSLPNLIIAGAPKSGTTSLFYWLQAHPSVVTSRIKETCYLVDPDYPLFKKGANYSEGGLSGYSMLFPEYAAGYLCMEATPDYMYQRTALKVLSELPTSPTIIFVLRNPVDRVLSLVEFAKNNVGSLDHKVSLEEFIDKAKNGMMVNDKILNDALLHGKYHSWLVAWMQACGDERVKVVFFENMISNPSCFMKDLCGLIGVDHGFYERFDFKPANQSRQIRSVKMLHLRNAIQKVMPFVMRFDSVKTVYRMINVQSESREVVKDVALLNAMYDYYEESNRELKRLLGRELPAVWAN